MPARPDRRATGDAAELAARRLLENEGLRLLARNVRFKTGELDLVMREGDTIVFVEVRFRGDERFGGALASIDRGKCRRIARAALAWLQRHPALAESPCRFDVVAAGPGGADWQRGAFTLADV